MGEWARGRAGERGRGRGGEAERVLCRSCGNACLPPRITRTYLCPRCRCPLNAPARSAPIFSRLLALLPPRPVASSPPRRWQRTLRLAPSLFGRGIGLLAPIAAVGAVLLLAHRAMMMPAPPRASRPALVVPVHVKPYAPEVERNYRYRIRQLEADLARDPREYLLRARLGLLHLRLASHTPDRKRAARRYAEARRRFEQAAGLARTRREHEWALAQQEACSEHPPVTDALDSFLRPDLVAATPPPSLALEEQLRLRVQFLEARVVEQPENARLLCRLGLTYIRLSQAAGRLRRAAAPLDDNPEFAPEACRRRAAECLRVALRHVRSPEIRAEIHLARADLHRAAGDLPAALDALRHALRLRPNHWPAQLQAAALLGRLGRDEEARAHRARAARWRTPEWL